MKKKIIFLIAALMLTSAFMLSVNGEGETISRTDPEGDVFTYGSPSANVDDVDLIGITVDWSGDPVTVELTVKGEMRTDYETDLSNGYTMELDLRGDGDYEITIAYIENNVSVISENSYDPLSPGDDYTINGGVLSVSFAKTHMGEYTDVQDVHVYSVQSESGSTDDGSMDEIPWGTGSADDDTSDDDVVDDDWIDDDWYDDDDDDFVDPADETPTDDSISVEIKDVYFKYDVDDEDMEIEARISGTTEGEVHHCSNIMVTYGSDGEPENMDDTDWEDGPEVTERMEFMGYTMEMYFKGTGDDGEDDWSEWEYYIYMSGPYDENMTDDFDPEDVEEGEKMVFFVRAYADEGETQWNQDSKDVTDEIMDKVNGDGSDDIPIGIGLVFAGGLLSLFAGVFLYGRRR